VNVSLWALIKELCPSDAFQSVAKEVLQRLQQLDSATGPQANPNGLVYLDYTTLTNLLRYLRMLLFE
jgi:hypothetical protein